MIKAIDRLFHRLSATYGSAWTREMGDTPISDAKTVWAHELAPFKHSLHRVAWALENLPERCPNVIAFKNLCRQAPAQAVEALPAPEADPARLAAELAKLGQVKASITGNAKHGMKDWAYRLKGMHEAGHRLNLNQITSYQTALRMSA